MRFNLLTIILAGVTLLCSCSKTPKNSPVVPVTPVVIPQPLPNTVDKTDTLNVMAYNVLGYGDMCQGNTATLNGYLQTIIQYSQPDLFSFEKMGDFPPASTLPGNLADDITTNALNVVFPGKYAYATPTNLTGADNMAIRVHFEHQTEGRVFLK